MGYMDITYSQKNGIKLIGKSLSIALDPEAGAQTDVVLLSNVAGLGRTLTTFDGPGEYEVKGCMIDGIALRYGTTAYRVELEEIKIGYLPVLPDDDKSVGALVGAEVLFVPLHDTEVEAVAKLVGSLEPKIVIPTRYNNSELKAFLAEMGAKDTESVDKLNLQRKDIVEDKQQVVVLQA